MAGGGGCIADGEAEHMYVSRIAPIAPRSEMAQHDPLNALLESP